MRGLTTKRLALFAVLAALVPSAFAQRMASGTMGHLAAPPRPAATAPNVPGGNGVRGHIGFGHDVRPFSRSPHFGPLGAQYFPLLADWLSPDDLYAAGYPVASQLPYVVVQSGPPAPADPADRLPRPPQESLLIELQGDRYVRVSDSQMASGAQPLTLAPNHDAPASAPRKYLAGNQSIAVAAASPAGPLPPVILVLRDGSRQEVRDYTIADGVLYAEGDFYTDGYWNKKIELSALNVPDTLSVNSARGVKFLLPSAPNQVITRP